MDSASPDKSRDAYLDLVKRAITNYLYLGSDQAVEQFRCVTHYNLQTSKWKIDALSRPKTLLTRSQLDLVQEAVLAVTRNNVPGDFLEAGIWRGGVIILMRALIDAYNIEGRKIVAADSFEGIPKNTRALNDPVDQWNDRWVASLKEVKEGIARFGLLDYRIEFLPGYFEDSLKALKGRTFSVIRLDSDSYDSVETSLEYLYPLVPTGGFVIIDDWHLPGCRMAVTAYREQLGIRDEVHERDGNAFWVKRQPYSFPEFPSVI
jgi:O-methyltransferase/8-demethyl-8-(2,3-dimethoxy-alpha-L-rhamnosyl)tetracenomycin-C 4'-O-methyltransferase